MKSGHFNEHKYELEGGVACIFWVANWFTYGSIQSVKIQGELLKGYIDE